ncbi:Sodium/calcium exchanger protein-domain-containing protein [Xylaria flabelliformis]|nr:Sodium/calcium exchanger protein-domain-containing protein [Xylaria flabelliformis]
MLLRNDAGTLSLWPSLKYMFFSSYINRLVIFVPVGIVTYYLESPQVIVFATNAVAIVPLSNILAHATECIATDLGDVVGALMNISFGNLVEIIMFFAALRHGHIRVVKSALVGSILVNLLLILGTSIIAAEFLRVDLVYDMNNAQALACLLSLSVFSILVPMAFHFTFKNEQERERAVRSLSRASAIILLIVYFVYLAFLLVPRRRTVKLANGGIDRASIDERRDTELGNMEPYIPEADLPQTHGSYQQKEQRPRTIRFMGERPGPSLSRPGYQEDAETLWEYQEEAPFRGNRERSLSQQARHDHMQRWIKGSSGVSGSQGTSSRHKQSLSLSSLGTTRSLRANDIVERYGDGRGQAYPSQRSRPHSSLQIVEPIDDAAVIDPNHKVSRTAAVIALVVSTLLTAICAEFLVDTIEAVTKSSGLTQSFIGLIILSIVGNAAEYITGVRVAARGKLDLAIGVSFGSSIQIALFVAPLTVIGGWIMGKSMTLYLGLFDTTVLVGASILVNFLMVNGKTNYLEGTLLCACYLIIG